MPPSSQIWPRSDGVSATAPSDHSTLFILIIEAWRCEASRTWGDRKVVRCDCGWDWGRISSLDIRNIGSPSRRAKAGVIENSGVDIDEALANTIFDVRQI